MLRKIAVVAAFALPFALSTAALADGMKDCTAEATDKWKSIEDVTKVAVAEGFTISKSKVEGSCYELYATDKEGKLWELFYNPMDAKLVEKEAK